MVIIGTYTALRISDLLRMKWSDVYDEERRVFQNHVTIMEQKTGKMKTIALNSQILGALRQLYPHRKCEFIFANNRKNAKAISRVRHGGLFMRRLLPLGLQEESPAIPCARHGDTMHGQAAPCPRSSLWKSTTTATIRLPNDTLG